MRNLKFIKIIFIIAFIITFYFAFNLVSQNPYFHIKHEVSKGHFKKFYDDVPITLSNRTSMVGDKLRLIYNRIPKCGSTTFLTLLHRLGQRNGFLHFSSSLYDKRHLTELEQKKFVHRIEQTQTPLSIDRHLYFVSFERFGASQPIYINIIRDPVDRLISAFYYNRDSAIRKSKDHPEFRPSNNWLKLTYEDCVLNRKPECRYDLNEMYNQILMIPYFCGHAKKCSILGNKWALQKAKYNIENYYSVVGILEQMNKTLTVLEKYIPAFFSNVHQLYLNKESHLNSGRGRKFVDSEVKEFVKKNLTLEYDLYNFVLQRLNLQFNAISKS